MFPRTNDDWKQKKQIPNLLEFLCAQTEPERFDNGSTCFKCKIDKFPRYALDEYLYNPQIRFAVFSTLNVGKVNYWKSAAPNPHCYLQRGGKKKRVEQTIARVGRGGGNSISPNTQS